MDLDKIPAWILDLEPEDAGFLKNFVLKSGSLKEIAKLYSVSYPTVRLRLDKLIQKIELSDQKEAAGAPGSGFWGALSPWSGSAFWPFSGPAARSPCPRTGRYWCSLR